MMENMMENMMGKHEEIVRMLREGKTVREVCRELRVSSKTVCRVRKELGLAARTGLRRAERKGAERGGGGEEEEMRRRLEGLERVLRLREEELEGLRRRNKVLRAVCFLEAVLVLLLVLLM